MLALAKHGCLESLWRQASTTGHHCPALADPNINSGGRTVGDQILFTRGIPLGMAHSGPYATPLMVASQFQLCKSQAFGMRASPRPGSCAVAVPIWTVQPPHGMT